MVSLLSLLILPYSWRIARNGNNLEIQRRESGNWVTKGTISA
jgi:hypothetical protein